MVYTREAGRHIHQGGIYQGVQETPENLIIPVIPGIKRLPKTSLFPLFLVMSGAGQGPGPLALALFRC